MAKLKLKNGEIVNFLQQEISDFTSEQLSFSLKFQFSKIQDEVAKAVKMIMEEYEKLQVIADEKQDNGNGELVDVLTKESAEAVNSFFNEEIELSFTPLKIKDIGDLVTDKPYRLVFKFFV